MALPEKLLPNEATLDAVDDPAPKSSPPSMLALNASLSHGPIKRCHQVELVEGSGPQLTAETRELLRTRLQAAALCLAGGSALMLLFKWLSASEAGVDRTTILASRSLLLVVLVCCAAALWRRGAIGLRGLRVYEALIFGAPLLYTAVVQRDVMMQMAEAQNHLPSHPPSTYVYLIYIYALFIPNSLKRAAWALGLIAGTPMLVTAFLAMQPCQCGILLRASPSYIGEMAVMLAIGYATSLYGAHMIGNLRREAFEARQFGQYKLCRLIGAGGMGEVYLAEHQLMKRPCAIKVIRPSKANDPQALARFEREVRATAKLTHWNTVEIFDYGRTDDGTFYYVMEYLPGMSVAELVERHGPLEPARVIHLLRQTCDALREAHSLNLIHRDLKPGNLFVAQRGGVYDVSKLLDFGLAKPLLAEQDSVQLTQEGSITGSPLYMSPEQAMGDAPPDARSDIYSLGCVAYYMLTGSPPFKGDNALKVIFAHANEPLTPPARLRPDVPADLERVIVRCLAKNPEDRYQSASELGEALARCATAGEWGRERAARWWKANSVERPAHAQPQPALV